MKFKFTLALAVLVLSAGCSTTQQQGVSKNEAQLRATAPTVREKEIAFTSASPKAFEEIIASAPLPAVQLSGRLYLPGGSAPYPAVIITPGSGGVSPAMVRHAQALVGAGIAAFLIDPFTGRGIKSTVVDQTQLSFATSTYDVLAAAKHLGTLPEIDAARVGAMGYSRGGVAVLQASISQLAQAVLGPDKALRAVVAGWPWCGYQFARPLTAPTHVRFLVGDSDNWTSPNQCQGYAATMAALNREVSIRLFKGAVHGFGYGEPIREIPDAMKALNAPIIYFNDAGVLIDWYSGEALPGVGDRYLFSVGKPFFGKGVRAGSAEGEVEAFIADFVAFFKRSLQPR